MKLTSFRPLGGSALRAVAFSLTAAALTACASAPENPMTIEQRQSLGIADIQVAVRRNADIWWGDAEREYASLQGCEPDAPTGIKPEDRFEQEKKNAEEGGCDYSALVESAEADAYAEQKAAEVLKSKIDQIVAPEFTGSRRATLKVDIETIRIVSGAQALLFGGSHGMSADMQIVEEVGGRVLASYPAIQESGGYAPGGVLALAVEAVSSDPYERMASSMAEQIRDWIRGE